MVAKNYLRTSTKNRTMPYLHRASIRPWKIIAMELFKSENSWYFLVADYPRYPELYKLQSTQCNVIIKCLYETKHGIPDILCSDNGPQFDPLKSQEFIYQISYHNSFIIYISNSERR